ncbi:transcription initiation factor TFIID subunit 8-like [Rutidosis leptorrhynchoides]|uniref:transcription initiation factor TFIID subunit 8-like n=1 Tax=Rutidosis leptorrhynchoides TaxID=125765 RepID=UPI003A998D07
MKKTKTKKKKFKDSSSSSSSEITCSESSDYHTAVSKIAVAQICKSVGYKGAQTTALETLTDIAVRYLQSIAKSAATSAISTGRTQCNLLDVIRAFEDLHSDLGFKGNSDPKKRLYILSNSSILRDTMKFVYRTREIPFAKPLPRRGSTIPSFSTCFPDERVKLNHIPRWLPSFPKIGDGGDKTVVDTANEGAIEVEKMCLIESDRKISKLPEKRRKVSFKISGGSGGRNEIVVKFGGDLRSGVSKRGKRILCEIYDDDDNDDGKPASKKQR